MTVIADKTFAINALRTRTGTNTTTLSAMTVLTMLPTSMQTDHASANQHGAVMTAASGESSVTQSVLNASPDKSH
jgi:hypothetical protein